jgi:hypothetical protein
LIIVDINQNFNNMKKLIFLIPYLFLLVNCSAQTFRTYSYGLNLPGYKLNGTQLTSTFVQLNYNNTLTGNVQTQLNGKQATLVNGQNFSTINGVSLLTGTPLVLTGIGTVTSVSVISANGISATVDNATTTPTLTFSLGNIVPNQVNGVRIASGGSTPVITVTGTSSILGANTGDNAVNSLYSGLVTNATHTGDATGSTALTVKGINSVLLSSLGTGLLKNTTGTGVPSIATAGVDYLTPSGSAASLTNFPTLNQATTANAGTATKWATARHINGVLVDGTADVSIPTDLTPGAAGNIPMSNGAGALVMDTPVDISTLIPTPGTAGNIQTSDGAGHWVSAANSSSTAGSIPEAASNPTTGNIYINTVDKKIHYLSGGYWHRVAILDSTSATASLNTGLIDYWNLDQNSTTQTDAIGSNNLTVGGATYYSTGGILGHCLDYTHNTDYAYKTPVTLAFGSNTLSISLWVKINTLPVATTASLIAYNEHTGWTKALSVIINPDSFEFDVVNNIGGGFQVESSTIPSTGIWYNVVCVLNGANPLKIYVNGSDVSTSAYTFSGTLLATSNWFGVGCVNNSDLTAAPAAYIDEVGFWNRALTSGEVTSLYNAGVGKTYPF